jgi:hypothetical protein
MFCLHYVAFYAISGTNLLTRCHSASSLFSAVFVFQKSYIANILEIGRNKDRNSYFARRKDEDRTGARWGPEGTLTTGWCPPPSWPRPGVVRPPWWPSDAASPPIKSLLIENPKTVGVFPRTVPQCRRCRRQILGDRSICSGTLLGRGSAP